jgi:small conductance mechanosensitive channel
MASRSPSVQLAVGFLFALVVGLCAAIALALVVVYEPAVWAANQLYIEGAFIVLIGFLLARTIGSAVSAALDRRGRVRHAPVVRLFVNIAVYAVVVAALLGLFGVGLENLFFGSAFAGIILGLAGQTVFANVLAGLVVAVSSPFRPGDRISVVSSSYGVISPSYAHELAFPSYTGTVTDIALIYTHLRLDDGQDVKIPNGALLQAMIVRHDPSAARQQRVRMTFGSSTALDTFLRGVDEYRRTHRPPPGRPEPFGQVADISASTWDGVVVLWTTETSEAAVQDEVLRCVLGELKGAAGRPAPGSEGPGPAASPTA